MKIIETEKAKFVAVVKGVKELRLIGKANLDFWNERLSCKPYQALDVNERRIRDKAFHAKSKTYGVNN